MQVERCYKYRNRLDHYVPAAALMAAIFYALSGFAM
jgi:hypothetical protein